MGDESRLGLVSDDYRERVWRERGGQNRLATAIGVAPYRGGTQMFWGGIRFNGRTQLIHIPGTMTGAYDLQKIIFNHYIMKSETSSSLWTIMPDPSHQSPSTSLGKRKHCKIGMAGNVP
nr:unnamed protein product [Callosobruchus chinensis]